MTTGLRSYRPRYLTLATAVVSAALSANTYAWYSPKGAVPEEKLERVARDWTREQVDTAVVSSFMKIPSTNPAVNATVSEGCASIQFVRHKLRSGPDNAAEADAALLMMPGVIEGANGFHYIARNMIYKAAMQRGISLEVWAVDRRSNCLEDLTGVNAAEGLTDVSEAEDVMIGYYYEGKEVDGKIFDGFKTSRDLEEVVDYGLAMATDDMFAVMEYMIPDQATRKEKVFVGGHSLGGLHTSTFLAWDRDGDRSTLDDAGYMNTAGAFGFDTSLRPVYANSEEDMVESTTMISLSDWLGIQQEDDEADQAESYANTINLLRDNYLPRTLAVEGAFNAEILALPEAMAVLAGIAPEEESTALQRLPRSLTLRTLLALVHSRDINDFFYKPSIDDFRYTNEALVGLIFDDNSTVLPFISTSLGFFEGGGMEERKGIADLVGSIVPILGTGGGDVIPTPYIATDAGPYRWRMGEGPLYGWADFDEVASNSDTEHQDENGEITFTTRRSETSDMDDFVEALYAGETNLTEWYFPTRLLLDLTMAAPYDFAENYGMYLYHRDGAENVPKIEFIAEEGIGADPVGGQGTDDPIVLEGMNHLDPMFAVANASATHPNPVIDRLLDFVESNLNSSRR